jgi:dTDP-4-amino-4,6-dideoxygalactose transaminase
MFRYQPEEFANLSRNQFVRALRAEGIPCSTGYHPLNKQPFIQDALNSRPYVRVYGKPVIEKWKERNHCPENEKLCDQAVWFLQNMFLGPRSDMDDIVAAILKIKEHAAEISRV